VYANDVNQGSHYQNLIFRQCLPSQLEAVVAIMRITD